MKTCALCGAQFKAQMTIDGKVRNLGNRRYCLSCSPFGSKNTVNLAKDGEKANRDLTHCRLCGREIPPEPRRRRSRCTSCNTKIRRYQAKVAAVKYLGGKCNRCGWSGPVAGFEFHHLDPSEKDFTIGNVSNRRWDLIKAELDKCELLCATCHRIEHSDRDDKFLAEASKYKGRLLQ